MSQDLSGPHPIDAPGTGERSWAAWPWLSAPPGAALTELACVGGLMSMLATAGTRLRLVAVTDGERSHQGGVDPDELARRRTDETTAALRALGAPAAEVVRLRLPDSEVGGREDELAAELASLTYGFDACFAPWDRDLHPDHEAAGRAARKAGTAALYYYPVWMWHWAGPAGPRVPWDRALRIPLTAQAAAAKRAAVGCFASQLRDRGHGLGPVLSVEMIAHFTRTTEVLLV